MINYKQQASEYLEAGALNEVLALHSFLDEHAFLTKTGDIGVVLRFPGIDFEGRDATDLDSLARRFEAAMRTFTEQHCVYQYLIKTSAPEIHHRTYSNEVVNQAILSRVAHFESRATSLYTVDIYIVITAHIWTSAGTLASRLAEFTTDPKGALRRLFSTNSSTTVLASELASGLSDLHNKVQSFRVSIEDVFRPELLHKQEAFRFFRRLLNYDPRKHRHSQLPDDDLLDYFAADSVIETHRGYIKHDDYFVQVLTLKQPPSSTFANSLAEIIRIPSDAILCTEFRRISNENAVSEIRSKQRHFHNTRTSFLGSAMAGDNPQPGQVLVNQAATALVADLGQCLEEIEVKNNYFGQFSFTLVLYNRDWHALSAAVAEAQKAFATKDALLTQETYNILNAYLAVVPGNSVYNLRRLLLTATNYADLSFLFTVSTGSPLNAHLRTEYLALLETQHATPYYFNLHYKDVAHTLITGSTGSGKSFLLNFILTNLQKYQPFTVIFDLGGSYRNITERLFNGSYSRVSIERNAFTINPFSLPLTPDNHEFIFSFVRVLLDADGGAQLEPHDAKELYEAIGHVYAVDPDQRRLMTLSTMLPRHLSNRLARWIEDGQYGSLFDNAADTLTFANFQCFDFEGLDKYPTILEPLLFYILHRANATIYDAARAEQFKAFVMDEAWRFFQNTTIKNYLREALKTWRKRNAAMILATQSGDDLRNTGILDVVLESCPTRIFLANPGMNATSYRNTFHLNATQAELVRTLLPKRQLFLMTPELSKILSLDVDPRSYWLYTNSPLDNARRDRLIDQHGLTKALDLLTSSKETQ